MYRKLILVVIATLTFVIDDASACPCATNVVEHVSYFIRHLDNSSNSATRRMKCTLPDGSVRWYNNKALWTDTPFPWCDVPITFQIYRADTRQQIALQKHQISYGSLDRHQSLKAMNGAQRPFFVITHGFHESPLPEWMEEMKDALLKQGYNVALVLWDSRTVGLNYYAAVADTRIVADTVSIFVNNLANNGLISLKKTVLVGHSLGAHISGMAGKQIRGLRAVIGLDPAGPFFDCKPALGLNRNAAQYVQILHTDSRGATRYGTILDRGHADYYANFGKTIQPGCSLTQRMTNDRLMPEQWMKIACSHSRAVEIFTEALESSNQCQFIAKPIGKTRRLSKDIRIFTQDTLRRLTSDNFIVPIQRGKFNVITTDDDYQLCGNNFKNSKRRG